MTNIIGMETKMHGIILNGVFGPKMNAIKIPIFRDRCEITPSFPRMLQILSQKRTNQLICDCDEKKNTNSNATHSLFAISAMYRTIIV